MQAELYFIEKKQPITDAIDIAFKSFVKKHGYPPEKVYLRQVDRKGIKGDEYKGLIIIEVEKGVTPRHFLLSEVIIDRKPNILKQERKPVRKYGK